MKKKVELSLLFVLIVVAIFLSQKFTSLVDQKDVVSTDTVVYLDPGHGGEDPGKVGIGDVLEKDLNLQISTKLKQMLEEKNITVMMTREDDSVPENKNQDLKQRVEKINAEHPTLTVCIHQNSYTDSAIKGAQVFYHTKTEDAKIIADLVQEELRVVDTENTREIKENDTYYMLKYLEIPTIIVECGFLTNPEEAAKLQNEDYQNQIAQAICNGVIKWLEN